MHSYGFEVEGRGFPRGEESGTCLGRDLNLSLWLLIGQRAGLNPPRHIFTCIHTVG